MPISQVEYLLEFEILIHVSLVQLLGVSFKIVRDDGNRRRIYRGCVGLAVGSPGSAAYVL